MKKNNKPTIWINILFISMCLATLGCKKKSEFESKDSFIRVYDNGDLNKNFYPLSMKQTADGGYLILSSYNGPNIHLMKTDELGQMQWDHYVPTKYTNAIPNIIERDGNLYFVCMDAVGLFTHVLEIDQSEHTTKEFEAFNQIRYPLALTESPNGSYYILNYERTSMQTGIYEICNELKQVQNSGKFNIYVDVEQKIVEHINFTGKRFPFFISTTPVTNHIVFSGFNNYSFSTVFLDENLSFSGVYSGAAFDGGINALLPLGGDKFSISRFSFSKAFYNASATLSNSAVEIAESVPAYEKMELDMKSPIMIKELSFDGSKYIAYLASTKSNKLLLEMYKKDTGELIGCKYLGDGIPLKGADFFTTSEGELILLVQATVMSSFNRIAMIKLPKEEFDQMLH